MGEDKDEDEELWLGRDGSRMPDLSLIFSLCSKTTKSLICALRLVLLCLVLMCVDRGRRRRSGHSSHGVIVDDRTHL